MAGSYNSAVEMALPPLVAPPATNTFPLASNVAVWAPRASVVAPVGLHVPVAGSYNSALLPA